jgi:hypothetical protein
MNYQKKILNFRKKKYSYFLYRSNLFFKSYLTNRYQFLKKNIEESKKKEIIRCNKKSLKKEIFVFNYLYNLYKKKNFSKKNIKIIFGFYKKFEINLKLKSIYSYKLIRKKKSETKINSYILLAFFVSKLKIINNLQKLNFLLKINDYILLYKNNINSSIIYKIQITNINTELKFLKKFLSKKNYEIFSSIIK